MGHRQYACSGQQAPLCDACICKHDVTWKVSDLLVGSVSLLSFSSHYQVDELHNAPRRAHTNSIAAGLPSKTVISSPVSTQHPGTHVWKSAQ